MARRNRKPDPEITEAPEVVETGEPEAEAVDEIGAEETEALEPEAPVVTETEEPEAPVIEPHPARVKVVFRGPGFGMLANKRVLPNEISEVSWNEWLRLRVNKKYERIDV